MDSKIFTINWFFKITPNRSISNIIIILFIIIIFIILLDRIFNKDGEDTKELRRRCAMVKADLWRMSKLMGSGKVSKDTKDRIFNCICLSKLMYGCESWRMNEKEKKMINAVESCYARLKANVKWTDMRTNKSVFEEVEMEQGDLVRKSEMPEPTRTTLTMTLRSQRGKLQD